MAQAMKRANLSSVAAVSGKAKNQRIRLKSAGRRNDEIISAIGRRRHGKHRAPRRHARITPRALHSFSPHISPLCALFSACGAPLLIMFPVRVFCALTFCCVFMAADVQTACLALFSNGMVAKKAVSTFYHLHLYV